MSEKIIQVKDKYNYLPVSIIKIQRNTKERSLRQNRKSNTWDKYYNESSRRTKSYFDADISEFILKYYARGSRIIVDPFAGWGERHFYAKKFGYSYFGFDISDEAIKYAKINFNVDNILADSRNIPLNNEMVDFCYTCPPYWNLEKYQVKDGQLSAYSTYSNFLLEYTKVIKEINRCLKQNSFCVFVVGDFRKKGIFYDFSTDTINIFKANSFSIFDKVIIDKSINYRVPIFLKQADKFGYTVKLHEYILVFQKI